MKKPARIIIVGGGASAVFFLARFVRQDKARAHITLIDRTGSFGRGVAYGTPQDCHLLNVRAGNMSAFDDAPSHFTDWLHARGKAYDAEAFVPRALYGAYLESVLKAAMTEAAAQGHRIDFLQASVRAITREGEIVTDKGVFEADAVVLATGNAIPRAPMLSLKPEAAYFSNPYHGSYDALSQLSNIAVLGAGLSMVDVILSLDDAGYRGKVVAISRHGLIPQPHVPRVDYPAFLTTDNMPSTILGIVKVVRQEIAAAKRKGIPWQAVIDALRPVSNALWLALPKVERLRMGRVMPFWSVVRHRIAPEVNAVIQRWISEGRLELFTAKVKSVEGAGNELSVMTDRGTRDARAVINCLGYIYNPRHPESLTAALPLTPEGVTPKISDRPRLYAVGPVLTGHYFESVAVPELRVQARLLAAHVADDLVF